MNATRLLPLLLLLALAPPAAGQACVGRPVPADERAVVAGAAYVSYDFEGTVDGADLGVAYWANPDGVLAYAVDYAHRSVGEGTTDLNLAGGELSLELPLRNFISPVPDVCLTGGARVGWLSGAPSGTEYTTYTFPVGLAVGVPVRTAADVHFAPYVLPQLLIARSEGTVLGLPVEDNFTTPAVEAGTGIGWGRFVARLSFRAASPPEDTGLSTFADVEAIAEVGLRF